MRIFFFLFATVFSCFVISNCDISNKKANSGVTIMNVRPHFQRYAGELLISCSMWLSARGSVVQLSRFSLAFPSFFHHLVVRL